MLYIEGLLSEEQCKARDVRRKQKTTKLKKDNNSPEVCSPAGSDKSEIEDTKADIKSKNYVKPETMVEQEPLLKVNDDTKNL